MFLQQPGRQDSQQPLLQWYDIVEAADFGTPSQVKAIFGVNADFVKVDSGRPVCVFDIGGNKYRLIAAIHYNAKRVFVLRVLTHRDYDSDRWKREL